MDVLFKPISWLCVETRLWGPVYCPVLLRRGRHSHWCLGRYVIVSLWFNLHSALVDEFANLFLCSWAVGILFYEVPAHVFFLFFFLTRLSFCLNGFLVF